MCGRVREGRGDLTEEEEKKERRKEKEEMKKKKGLAGVGRPTRAAQRPGRRPGGGGWPDFGGRGEKVDVNLMVVGDVWGWYWWWWDWKKG